MQIQISEEQYRKLTQVALTAGFEDVSAFLRSLADGVATKEYPADPRGSLLDEQIEESVAQLKRADAAIDAGHGVDLEDAIESIASKHEF